MRGGSLCGFLFVAGMLGCAPSGRHGAMGSDRARVSLPTDAWRARVAPTVAAPSDSDAGPPDAANDAWEGGAPTTAPVSPAAGALDGGMREGAAPGIPSTRSLGTSPPVPKAASRDREHAADREVIENMEFLMLLELLNEYEIYDEEK